MPPDSKWRDLQSVLQNTAFGILVGTVLSAAAALIADSSIAFEWKKLYTFLIAALITLISATFAIAGVIANIENQNKLAAAQRSKKLKAAEAVLPMSLSAMIEACDFAMLYSKEFDKQNSELGSETFAEKSDRRLGLQPETLTVFKEVIEFTDDLEMANRLADVLRRHQVYRSRWRNHFTRMGAHVINQEQQIKNGLVDWVLLKALIASVFAYSRGLSDSVEEIDELEIYNALQTNDLTDLFHEDYEEEVRVRYEGFREGLI